MVRLHADSVKVTAPSGRASKMEAQGHVVVDSPSGKAVGDAGFYDVSSQVLRLNGNNKSRASEILGISRESLYRKMKQYGIAL